MASDKNKEETKTRMATIRTEKLLQSIKTDTGMDIICTCEMRWRSKESSVIIVGTDHEQYGKTDEEIKKLRTVTFTAEQEAKYLIVVFITSVIAAK